MKTLILGGHGFVGKNLAPVLKGLGHEVACLSRRDGLDLTDLAQTNSAISEHEPDAIFNLAAHVGSVHYVADKAGDVIFDNVQMALNLYKAVSERPHTVIVNPLSNCSYPGDANIHSEPDWWAGEVHDSVFSYGNAKRFIYVVSKNFRKQYGIKTVNFLVPNTFGPGDYTDPNRTHALNGMIIRMLQAKHRNDDKFEIWGTGKPIREWGYIDDVAKVLAKGLEVDADLTYPVNVAQNKGYSIGDSARMIAKAIGFGGELVFNTKYQDGAPTKILDNTRFKELFPDFEFFDHEQGIVETARYYEEQL